MNAHHAAPNGQDHALPLATLWDMDGTIIDSEPLWLRVELAMLARYGIDMPADLPEQLVGTGLRDAARRFQELGVPLTVDTIVDEWADGVVAGMQTEPAVWRPGARELLAELGSLGVPAALVTMSVRRIADAVVDMLPAGTFAAVVAGDEVTHEKPHPEPYVLGAQALGVAIEECVAFEDSRTGVRSAAASGAVTIGLPNMVSLADAPAHEVWDSGLAGRNADDVSKTFTLYRSAHSAGQDSHLTSTIEETDMTDQPSATDAAAETAGTPALRGPFVYGDRVQLTGPKGRMNTFTLEVDGEFQSHRGTLPHAKIVGQPDASVVTNSSGEEYLLLRPLLSDFVMSMPRGAAIVYPKDAAQILSLADIFPGANVVEAGVGSGALSLHLLRGIGSTGTLRSFERRDEFAEIARANVRAFTGEDPANWSVTVGDLQDELPNAVEPGSIDRVVLDMLAPWECVDIAADALAPGGVIICYVATVTQLSRTVEEMRRSGLYTHPQASETMVRGWHVEGLAVRPDHRMVAHTGFLVTARRLAPNTTVPDLKRRASKSDFTDADLANWLPDMGDATSEETWTPEAVGERVKSDKILRKKAREAQKVADQRADRAEG